MGFTMTRRQLVGGAAAVALLGLTGLTGCGGGGGGLSGKTLYAFPTTFGEGQTGVDEGGESTITFDDGETWHYAGSLWDYVDEMSGTWAEEGEDVVLTPSEAYGAITLRRLDGEDGYSVASKEDLGVRFYQSEDDARAYAEQSIEGAADRVREILESSEWGSGYRGITPTRAPEVEFADGGITYKRGEFPGTMVLRGPDEGDWEAGDHSGACDISVASLSDVGSGVSVPQYKGTISVGGEQVDFVLTLKDQAQLDIGQWSPFVAAA